MHRYPTRPAAMAVAIAAAILLSARPAAAQEATPDPATAAAERAAREAVQAAGPRFQVVPNGYGGCVNEPPEDQRVAYTVPPGFVARPGMNGGPGWQVSAPRGWPGPLRPGDPAELALRDKVGVGSRLVYADVVRPDGTFSRAGTILFDDGQGRLVYPSAFRDAPPTVAGVYTVVWRDTVTDRFIACDGFEVAP